MIFGSKAKLAGKIVEPNFDHFDFHSCLAKLENSVKDSDYKAAIQPHSCSLAREFIFEIPWVEIAGSILGGIPGIYFQKWRQRVDAL